MALTPSNMIQLGTKAPEFNLHDVVSDQIKKLSDVSGPRGTMIMFICNHCPYVVHIEKEIAAIARDYKAKEIGFVAISSNDVNHYPEDSPEHMLEQVNRSGFDFPYFYDESQEVAKAYDAACTPDFYLFDQAMKLVYRGRIDESRPKSDIPVTGKDMREALDLLIEGRPQMQVQYPSMGCNIKWLN
ncbi:MAG: thioredoxin family protein [Cyclobacteriaceae bacterium]